MFSYPDQDNDGKGVTFTGIDLSIVSVWERKKWERNKKRF